jgi:Spy/CpxP family protein refolding chaperone
VTRRLAIALVAVVTLGSTAAPAAAQALTPAEVERMWDTYMTSQARGALNLTDEQFMRFTVELQALQNLRRRQQRLRNSLRAELTALVEAAGPPDRGAVEAKLRAFDDAAVQAAQQVRRAYTAIDAVLTIRQRVRFRIFEERMARRKLDLLSQARAAARRGGGGGRR